MGDTRIVHPPADIQPPYWKGVSFLAGGVGDFLYGTYGRSTNTMVSNGTEVRKRSGYIRAFEELFEGSAKAVHHRESGFNYTIAADGEGVKILSALTPRAGGGDRYEHWSYPSDDFDRDDSATLYDSDSLNFWLEADTGHSGSGGTTYNACEISSNQLKVATNAQGSAELGGGILSPFWAWRMEVDLSSVDPPATGSTGATQLWLFLAMPNEYRSGSSVYNQRWTVHEMVEPSGFTNGHGTDKAWQGVWARIYFEKTGAGGYQMRVRMYAQLSGKMTNQAGTRTGQRYTITSGVYEFANQAEFQQTHYIEFGREALNDSKVNHKLNFYSGASKDKAPYTEVSKTWEGRLVVDQAYSGKYYTLASPLGDYGHCGLYLDCSNNSGQVLIDESSVTASFIT